MTHTPLGLQSFNHLCERQLLMSKGSKGRFACFRQKLTESHIARESGAQHEIIDEAANQPFCLFEASPCDWDANAEILLLRITEEQRLKGCDQGHRQGCAFAATEQSE